MRLRRNSLVSAAILGMLALVAVFWCGFASQSAWAQGAPPPMPPGGPPPPPGAPGAPPPTLPSLINAVKLAQSPDLTLKQKGLQDLGQIYGAHGEGAHPEVQQILRQALIHGETPEIRRAALTALGGRITENVDVILQATFDSDPDVVKDTLMFLAQAPPSSAVDDRLEALGNYPVTSIAVQAVDILMKHLAREGEPGIVRLVMAMGSAAGDANAKAALQLVAPIGRAAVPACMQALATSPNATQRHGAALILDMLCGGKTERQTAFLAAAEATFVFVPKIPPPDPRPLPVLMQHLLSDSSDLVRECCAEALGNIGDPTALPALIQAVRQDPAPNVRASAAQALELIPGTQALPALAAAVVSDPYPRVRELAVVSLGWMHDPKAAAPLIQATRDKDAVVRRLAAVQLGRLATPDALESLLALSRDPDEDVRWAAVIAVDKLPVAAKSTPASVDALVAAAEDPSPLVSHAAETALQHLGVTRREESHFRTGGSSA